MLGSTLEPLLDAGVVRQVALWEGGSTRGGTLGALPGWELLLTERSILSGDGKCPSLAKLSEGKDFVLVLKYRGRSDSGECLNVARTWQMAEYLGTEVLVDLQI